MRTYDAFADATKRGIEVQYLPISTARMVWLPDVDGIVISSHAESVRERRDILAHALAHADIEDSKLMRKFRVGRATSEQVETRVRRIAARRLIHSENLQEALLHSNSAIEIAHYFDVEIGTLADRMRDLSMREFRLFGRLAARVEWPRSSHHPAEQNCGLGCAKEASRPRIAVTHAAMSLSSRAVAVVGAAAAAIGLIAT